MQRKCVVCGKVFTNPGKRCNSCRNKAWKIKNREKDLAQRRAYNKRRWQKIRVPVQEKRCKFCDQLFLPDKFTPNQPYCSKLCRERAWRRDNREHYTARRKEERRRLKQWYSQYDDEYKDRIRYSGNRKKALERDDYTCLNCDSQKDLVVHHNDGTGQTETPNNEFDNLQTLCRPCHIRIHTHQVTK